MHTQTVMAFGPMRSDRSWFMGRRGFENMGEHLPHSFIPWLAVHDPSLVCAKVQLRLPFGSVFQETQSGTLSYRDRPVSEDSQG